MTGPPQFLTPLPEDRYTLEEAKREIAFRECAEQGHYFEVQTVYGSNRPVAVICSRCGESWPIAPAPLEETS